MLKKLLAALIVLSLPLTAWAQGTIMPAPIFQAADSNLNPISNGKLCVYQAGTTTPADTYTSAALTTPNANPVRTNSAGRATVFLSPGQSYKFILKTAGTDDSCATGSTIWTQDGIAGVPTTSGNAEVLGTAGESLIAGDVVYLSDGSGGATAGTWRKADADLTYASVTPQIGMVPSAISSGAVGTIRIAGKVTGLTGLTAGTRYFISATAGQLTTTAPANHRVVGDADSSSTLVLFPALPNNDAALTITTTGVQAALPLPVGTGLLTLFANNASLLTLQGIAAGTDGQQLTLYAIGSATVDLTDQNPSAGTSNRIITGRGATLTLVPGAGSALLQYDGTATRWRVLSFMGTSTSTITTTGTQTALGIPTGMGALTIFANNATLLTLQGITAGVDGQSLTIYAIGAGQVDLANQNGSASAPNRIINSVTGTISLAAGSGRVTLQYDGTTARWRVTNHEQGEWITPTFSAGNFTASSGTWTLASGDVSAARYILRGKTLTVAFAYITTTVSATPATLQIGNGTYGGFTASPNSPVILAYLLYNDNGAGNAVGYCTVNASDTKIGLSKLSGTWSAAADTTNVYGTISFDVN